MDGDRIPDPESRRAMETARTGLELEVARRFLESVGGRFESTPEALRSRMSLPAAPPAAKPSHAPDATRTWRPNAAWTTR